MRAGTNWRRIVGALAAALLAGGAQASGGLPALRVEAQRGHTHCPLPGQDERSLLIDSRDQWRALVSSDEIQALGRAVSWGSERVLLYAMPQQPTLGISVAAIEVARDAPGTAPRLGLRITRPAPDQLAATALSRPCVFVVLTRGAWREVRVADATGHPIAVARLGAAAPPTPGGAAPGPAVAPFSIIEPVKPAAASR